MTEAAAKEEFLHEAIVNPPFGVAYWREPRVTDSNGIPWTAAYVNENGDPTIDLRSNIAAESRAKIVYEYRIRLLTIRTRKKRLPF